MQINIILNILGWKIEKKRFKLEFCQNVIKFAKNVFYQNYHLTRKSHQTSKLVFPSKRIVNFLEFWYIFDWTRKIRVNLPDFRWKISPKSIYSCKKVVEFRLNLKNPSKCMNTSIILNILDRKSKKKNLKLTLWRIFTKFVIKLYYFHQKKK